MTPVVLKRQFAAVKGDGWLPFFEASAKKYNIPVSILLGIGSRETNLQNIIGDHKNGYGIMQIDRRYYPEWCASEKWKNPEEAIRMGAWVLHCYITSAKRWLQSDMPGKYDVMRGAIAAYNSGRRAFMNYIVHGNPDLGTTGHDYSKDVLARAEVFTELIRDKS